MNAVSSNSYNQIVFREAEEDNHQVEDNNSDIDGELDEANNTVSIEEEVEGILLSDQIQETLQNGNIEQINHLFRATLTSLYTCRNDNARKRQIIATLQRLNNEQSLIIEELQSRNMESNELLVALRAEMESERTRINAISEQANDQVQRIDSSFTFCEELRADLNDVTQRRTNIEAVTVENHAQIASCQQEGNELRNQVEQLTPQLDEVHTIIVGNQQQINDACNSLNNISVEIRNFDTRSKNRKLFDEFNYKSKEIGKQLGEGIKEGFKEYGIGLFNDSPIREGIEIGRILADKDSDKKQLPQKVLQYFEKSAKFGLRFTIFGGLLK